MDTSSQSTALVPPSKSTLERWKLSLSKKHDKTPLIRKLQPRATGIILFLVLVNLIVWGVAAVVLAIDLMTRRLVASGQRPVTVGTWFSLGHSTIVVITAIVVAATASAIESKFKRFSYVGGIVGTAVSAAFLILLGVANLYILHILVRHTRRLLARTSTGVDTHINADESAAGVESTLKFEGGGGLLFRTFKRLFKIIDRPWKMYPLGVLFGLGFDTSSEIALLGISAIQATRGTSLWLILVLPVLFTAGMCLVDTIDGALMLCLYSSVALAKDGIAIAYYNVVLTGITVVVAIVIGIIQVLSLVVAVVGQDRLMSEGGGAGSFWRGVVRVGENYDIVGGVICGAFVTVGVMSVLLYKPWRRWVDNRRRARSRHARSEDEEGGAKRGESTKPVSREIISEIPKCSHLPWTGEAGHAMPMENIHGKAHARSSKGALATVLPILDDSSSPIETV